MTAPGTITPERGGRRRGGTLTHRSSTGFLLVVPALVFVITFVIVPLVFAVYISLTNWPLIGTYSFVGLANFTAIVHDTAFVSSVLYTLLYTAIVTVPILVLGYLMAVAVRRKRRGSTLLRTIFFLPYVIGLSTLSFMLGLEAKPGSGLVNVVLEGLGITDGQTAWLTSGPLATALICALVVWGVSALTMLLLASAMQSIPGELYESAAMDGASWWQREVRITIPMLRRTIAMTLVLSIIGSFLGFTQFYVLTQGGPGTATTTVVMDIYNRGFVQLQVGAATALSLVLVVVVGLVSALQFFLLREKG